MRRFVMASALLVLLFTPGCGDDGWTVRVTGSLLKAGVKYAPPEGQLVTITFVGPEIATNTGKVMKGAGVYVADLNDETGAFTVPGLEGRGIPPGRYRIAVTQKMTREAFEAANIKPKPGEKKADRETDFLDKKFSIETSPIVREIHSSTDLKVDLDKPTEG